MILILAALRQSGLEDILSAIYFLPLALFVPPVLFTIILQLHSIYQFFIHTQLIPKLPWLIELVFNTASHHRVHHGNSNQAYFIQ